MITKTTPREEALQRRTRAAMEEFECYCQAHPSGPAAVRRPTLTHRHESWVVLLGSNIETGVVGLGQTVTAALRAFEVRYLNFLRPPND